MPIRKGEDWGEAGGLDQRGVVVCSDGEARSVVETARRAGRPIPSLGLVAGDLARTLGATGDVNRLRSAEAWRFPLDLGRAVVDGSTHWFVAHLVARRPRWSGRFVVAMNSQWLGDWDMAPRAHPGDGRLDLVEGTLSAADRIKARGRLPHGGHLPHPDLATRRVRVFETIFDRPTVVRLDGESVGKTRRLEIALESSALTIVV